jgi:hypothetical protein
MKYLALSFLSLAAFLNADAAPSAGAELNASAFVPVRTLQATPRDDNTPDGAIAAALAAALIALQLRRRQKSLRIPRPLN